VDKIIVATGNMGKLREIREICAGLPFELVSLKEQFGDVPNIPEDGDTFLANATQKAKWVFDCTGVAALADDSGLEVDFLEGEPGVRSARFASDHASDKDNLDKLLLLCSTCPIEKRTARFRCVVVLILSPTESLVGSGTCEGTIGFAPKGTDGFGYDPVFYPKDYDRTFAELDSSVKNTISHRSKALLSLRRQLDERYH